MPYPYYQGTGSRPVSGEVDLPPGPGEKLHDPSQYVADAGLRDAANVALMLGRPLLITGEPGTGKTDFATSLAWELGLPQPLRFETKSSSTARDLFYVYDTLGRFHAAHNDTGTGENRDYITYAALGLALILANPPASVEHLLPQGFKLHGAPQRSVVLIDEVDKASRDFPNDILNELDRMFFRIPELGNAQVSVGEPKKRPVIVITSNSEKHLPDAFLRRCVYYDVPFPDADRLREIVERRLGYFGGDGSPFLSDALNFFERLRAPSSGLGKRPSTAELLDWLIAMRGAGARMDAFLCYQPAVAAATLGALVKGEDQRTGAAFFRRWIESKVPEAPTEARPAMDAWLRGTTP